MRNEDKRILAKYLNVGDEIRGIVHDRGERWFSGIVTEVTEDKVTYNCWGDKRYPESISPETIVRVQLSDAEFEKKYQKKAEEVYKALQNKLAEYEIGHHEMDNGWISYDIYTLAKNSIDRKFTILGYSEDITAKSDLYGDIGICAETEEGNKFWCHADKSYVLRMLKIFERKHANV